MENKSAEKEYMEDMIARYSESMMRAAYSVVCSMSESEDIVQDAFIKLYTLKPVFIDKNHEKAWLLRVTVNEAKNRVRQLKKLRRQEEIADKVFIYDDEQRIVMEAVQSLDEKYRIVTHLHFYEGYTIREIAEILNMPTSTVGTRLERAKAQLRIKLKSEGF